MERKFLGGLTSVAELELSNSSINSDDLKQMFSPSSITSNLRYLNLSMCHIPLIVDQAVIDSLASRPLELLDLSHNNKLTFDFGNSSELCTTLTTLILHDSSITILDLPPFCSSLQFVDLSGKQEMATELKQCVNNIAYIELRNVFYFARVMHLDRLITDTKAYLTSNCHVFIMSDELRTVKHKIIEFYFSYNSISQFEILFDFVYAGNSLKLISLSHNSIENINKRAFFYLDSLEKIDLSHNQLSQMSDNKGTFQDLFLNNQNLTSIDLSSNGLSHLPDETFLLNLNLAEIGLSRNAFSQLSFNFSYLNDLSVLDMRFNKIKYLDSGSRQMVDLMYANNYLEKNFGKNTTLQILLEGNPFTCRCEALGFLEWFMSSPIVNSSYTCVIDGQKIPMPELAVQTAREECEKPKRRRRTIVLSTLLPIITLAAIIGAIIFSYRRYKRRQEQRLLEDKLRLIQEELTRFPYTVFLSYSSDDTEFVRQHIRPQMERNLREYTKTEKDHISDADFTFVPGHSLFIEIERCVAEAAVFIAVVSENFCKSYYCNLEIAEADQTRKPIILLFKEHVNENVMGILVKNLYMTRVRAKIVQGENGNYQMIPDWKRMCEAIIGLMKIE